MNYKKELNYLNNMEAQFRVIGEALELAKGSGLKTITLPKELWLTKKKRQTKSGQK